MDEAREILARADRVLVLTGAGASVDAGLPAYRTPGGFWTGHPVLRSLGVRDPVDLCDPRAFRERPRLAWGFYLWRYEAALRARPHAGHAALLELARTRDVWHLTTNVDGLLQRAGVPGRRVVEVHGELRRTVCPNRRRCGQPAWSTPRPPVRELQVAAADLPRCPSCGTVARPNVLMFGGDDAFDFTVSDRRHARLDRWLGEPGDRAGLAVLEVGAGGAIATLRYLSRRFASRGVPVVRVNPEEGLAAQPGVELVPVPASELGRLVAA